MSVHGNIYYVGRSSSPARNIRQPLFSGFKPRKLLSPTSAHNQSRSTSCPKTQRSRYMKSVDQLRTMSPIYRHNTMLTRKALQNNGAAMEQRGKQNKQVKPVKMSNEQERGKSNSKQSSAFQTLLQRKDVVREGEGDRKQKVIRFRKVEQPKQKHVHWKTENQFKTRFTAFKTQKNPLSFPAHRSNQYLIKPAKPHNIDSPIDLSHYSAQSQDQQPIPEQYVLQPLKKLFLCRRCYQFTPIIELRSHHLNCNIPIRKDEFKAKWKKLTSLLEECFREQESNSLYRLIDRLKWYLEGGQQSRKEGYILYSEELGCLLSLKGSISVSCLSEDDLFWVIQSLGDLIETKSLTLDETAFWKICT